MKSNSPLRKTGIILGIVFICVLLSLVLISAEKINEPTTLIQTCNNCTFCNVSQIVYPNQTIFLSNQVMNQDGSSFNYILNSSYTNILGTYSWWYYCGNGVDSATGKINFDVTPSGQPNISSGQGLTLLGSLLVIVLGGIAFFILFFKAESLGFKTVWGALAVTDMIIAILFSMVLITQVVGGYDSLVTGFTTFWFVVQILIFIGFSAFILFAFYLSFMLWKFKRGYIN